MKTDNLIKKELTKINEYFRRREERFNFNPQQDNLKIDRNYGFIKNFMRLTNKTIIGINKIHIIKWHVFYGLLGMLTGYAFSNLDTYLMSFLRNHRKDIKQALILHVLRNEQIKDTLTANLLENVYKNADIQFNLHELLYWKAIKPQQSQLFNLTKQHILKALTQQTNKAKVSQIMAQSIASNQNTISKLTLQFLQSQKLSSIVSTSLSSLLRSQMFHRLLSGQFIAISNTELQKHENRDSLYYFLRHKYMNV